MLQENIQRAVTRINRIVSTKPAIPILSNLLLHATKDGLIVTSSSLETTETVEVGAKTEREGALCVPAKLFSELVSSLPPDTVTLEEKEGSLLVVCKGVRATVAALAGAEFPPVGVPAGKKETGIDKEELVRILSLVLFAAATDEGRPLLTGVKVVAADAGATFAATDGYRLSTYRSGAKLPKDMDIVVPARALGEVARVCQEEKEVKEAALSDAGDGQLVVRVGDTDVVTRKIDGEYPNFEKIIPTKHTTRATLDVAALTKAVKSASIFARDSANIVRLHVAKNQLTISANTPQVGENTVDVDAKTEGEEGDVAFNSRFLLELLAGFPGEELVFEMTGALNPGVFTSPKDPAFTHLIMPVRTQS